MIIRNALVLLLATAVASAAETPVLRPDPPKICDSCAEWNAPRAPFKVFGNTYFVGPAGLGSLLITSDEGYILLDGGLAQTASVIDANIRALGLPPEKIRVILNSHAHHDHAGGIAALARLSGARVVASPAGARAIERGGPTEDDPQFAFGQESSNAFPAVPKVESIAHGETLRLGSLAVTAHHTPGHTPGSTTWTWRSCEGERCLNLVYADSLNAVSAPGFRFTGDATTPSRVAQFEASIAVVEGLACDIVVTVHPAFAGLDAKLLARASRPATDPFIDPNGCRTYAAAARKRLLERVAQEKAAGTAPPGRP